jgi:uncharacterized lipoprotein YehR (DUF1307 family)
MKHRWKSAVLALLMAVLLCAALTGCELEEVANPYISISGNSGTDKWTTDSEGAYWTVTRTLKEEKVTKALKENNYCLYQVETVAATNNEDIIKQVSLLYVLEATNYWDVFDGLADEEENTLQKSADTAERRYVLVTFDYAQNGQENKPTKVTLRYEAAAGKNATNVPCESVYTFNTRDINEAAELEYESGVKFGTEIKSGSDRTTTSILNAALKVVLADNIKTNTIADVQTRITKLASKALDSAEMILEETRTKRKADVNAKVN